MTPLDNTESHCLPASPPRVPSKYPWRMIQTPTHKAATHIFMLFEANIHSYRQIFMDGRRHPADLDPTWYGHSIGRWEGDTLVIDTVGFNDRGSLDGSYPQSVQKHLIERWTRKDLGHMVNEVTIDDPGGDAERYAVAGRWHPGLSRLPDIVRGGDVAHALEGPSGFLDLLGQLDLLLEIGRADLRAVLFG